MGCEHLSSGLEKEILQKVAWVRGMRLQGGSRTTSASLGRRLLLESRHANLRHKSEDLAKAVCRPRAGPAGEQLLTSYVARFGCAKPQGEQPDVAALAAASELQCDESLPELQPPANQSGEPQSVEVGMAGWAPGYHSNIACARNRLKARCARQWYVAMDNSSRRLSSTRRGSWCGRAMPSRRLFPHAGVEEALGRRAEPHRPESAVRYFQVGPERHPSPRAAVRRERQSLRPLRPVRQFSYPRE